MLGAAEIRQKLISRRRRSKPMDTQIEEILKRMTLKEKI